MSDCCLERDMRWLSPMEGASVVMNAALKSVEALLQNAPAKKAMWQLAHAKRKMEKNPMMIWAK